MSFADIVSPDGQTGYDLFWMSGSLEARVFARDGDTWEIVIRMTGTFSTPWPDKVTRIGQYSHMIVIIIVLGASVRGRVVWT